jgi:hypothetical protein
MDIKKDLNVVGTLSGNGSGLTNVPIQVSSLGTLIGTRKKINFIAGTNILLTVADDAPNDRVNVTVQFKLE